MKKLIEITKRNDKSKGRFLKFNDISFLDDVETVINKYNFNMLVWDSNTFLIHLNDNLYELEEIILNEIVKIFNEITFECEACGNFEYSDNKKTYQCKCGKKRCEECYNDGTCSVDEDGESFCDSCVEAINDEALGESI